MAEIIFAVEYAVSRSLPLSAQVANNLFVERQPPTSKSQSPLFGVPGLDLFANCASPPNRGSFDFNGVACFVQGNALFTVSENGVATEVGSGIGGAGLVSMSCNNHQLIIVNGAGVGAGQGFIWDGATFSQITDPNFYPSDLVWYFDGYFVLQIAGNNEFYLSNIDDGLTYNGLDFATAEAKPGFTVGSVENLELLFVFCQNHIEIWYDAGTFPFPFQRYAGGVIPYGCISPHSIIEQDGAIFFLGVDKVFYRLQANVPIRVSTHPIETAIAKDDDIVAAFCSTFTIEGHKMVALTLPNSLQTLTLDLSTGKWHQRESWNTIDGGPILPATYSRWRAVSILEIYQRILVGDMVDGRIGVMNWSSYQEYGNDIVGLARSAPSHHGRDWLFVDKFELDIEAGVGTTSGPGSDPQIMLRYSKDGGRTWSRFQPYKSMGRQGAYGKRLRWFKQGRALQWVWEIRITDPVKRVIIAADADIQVGM